MSRAYRPRLSTVHLAWDINALPGVESVRILPPRRSAWSETPTRLWITMKDGERLPRTLPEARAWLKAQKG